MNKVLVFGTFDGIHEGHRAMLREAKTHGYVTVAVAPDSTVHVLKNHPPKYSSSARITALKNEHIADAVILGDAEPRTWEVIRRVKPSVIALGYDQEDLKQALEEYLEDTYPDVETSEGTFEKSPKKPTIVILRPFQPETYHSSLIS